eukprot:TRINITY_DN5392_c0_g1_i1.p1 TRINITY_DN5392_c0_g1~~TRINITY_DN5392_c0_g1_i1.p1  ORF type:complete len:429 (+),score=110.16 TRINITY_DN5392_c0_g1_i1:818-2104(+)
MDAAMVRAIDDCGGSAHFDDIVDSVSELWPRPSVDCTDEVLKRNVAISLASNPMFVPELGNPNFWFLAKKYQNHDKHMSDNDHEHDLHRFKPLKGKSGKPASVPHRPGMHCSACGTPIPGRGPNAKWKVGYKGEMLCVQCNTIARRHACPVCHKMYRQGRDKDEDEWIQCDDCHRWVMTRCDSAIVDLSLYDDSNPNHLHYSCPICRSRQHDSVPRSGSSDNGFDRRQPPLQRTPAGTPVDTPRVVPQPQPPGAAPALAELSPEETLESELVTQVESAWHELLVALQKAPFICTAQPQPSAQQPAGALAVASRVAAPLPPPLPVGVVDELTTFKTTLTHRLLATVQKQQWEHDHQVGLIHQRLVHARSLLVENALRQLRERVEDLASKQGRAFSPTQQLQQLHSLTEQQPRLTAGNGNGRGNGNVPVV